MGNKTNFQNTQSIGKTGEQAAANYLSKKGYRILAMNFKNESGRRVGEIDIIAEDPMRKEIVFVEVKTRSYHQYGETLPEENIGYLKLQKMAKIAYIYLRKNHCEDKPHRFDAISVWLDWEKRRAKIKHLPDIFLQ